MPENQRGQHRYPDGAPEDGMRDILHRQICHAARYDLPMFRRACIYATFATAAGCGISGVLMLLSQFIDWLQGNPWPHVTLLRVAMEYNLIPSGWTRFPVLANGVFTVLHAVPVSVFLLLVCPLLWWLGKRLRRVL